MSPVELLYFQGHTLDTEHPSSHLEKGNLVHCTAQLASEKSLLWVVQQIRSPDSCLQATLPVTGELGWESTTSLPAASAFAWRMGS